jgi:AcrR family transcriptional regulator
MKTTSSRRRDRIVDVAISLFAAMEYEDVSVDEICRQADVAKGLVFYYFGDKRGLFATAVEQVSSEMVAFQQSIRDENTPTLRVQGYIERHFEYVQRSPKRFGLLIATDRGNAEIRETVAMIRRQAATTVARSLGCPVNPPTRLRQAIRAWIGFVDAVTLDWLAHRDTEISDMVDLCVQALVAAVRAASGYRFDFDTELEALTQVSLTSEPWGESARPLAPVDLDSSHDAC